MSNTEKRSSKSRFRFTRIFAPFLFLVFVVLFSGLFKNWSQRASQNKPIETVEQGSVSIESTKAPTATPTLNSTPIQSNNPKISPTASATLIKEFSISTEIKLVGPPPGSKYHSNDTVALYWFWPDDLSDDQYFSIFLLNDKQETFAGKVSEPALGNHGYIFSFEPIDFTAASSTLNWEIRLMMENNEAPLQISENRPFEFILDG